VITDLLAGVDLDVCVHAIDIDSGAEVGHRADAPVVPASVFKVPVLLELFRQASAGELDVTTPVPFPVEGRAAGPFGFSVMKDPATMSLRDLAWPMIGISDNAATDLICHHVGLDNVNATLERLGFKETRVNGDCRAIFVTMIEDAGVETVEDFPPYPDTELLAKLRALDPARSPQRTTPREMTSLLGMMWRDEAADPATCEEVRRILGLQVWPHRLASGFPEDEVVTAGKTGTLPCLRNEVGVVTYPDGGRYAVAVFTRRPKNYPKDPQVDALIGRIARAAVDELRGAAAASG
jgi:beta-lactamase class A